MKPRRRTTFRFLPSQKYSREWARRRLNISRLLLLLFLPLAGLYKAVHQQFSHVAGHLLNKLVIVIEIKLRLLRYSHLPGCFVIPHDLCETQALDVTELLGSKQCCLELVEQTVWGATQIQLNSPTPAKACENDLPTLAPIRS